MKKIVSQTKLYVESYPQKRVQEPQKIGTGKIRPYFTVFYFFRKIRKYGRILSFPGRIVIPWSVVLMSLLTSSSMMAFSTQRKWALMPRSLEITEWLASVGIHVIQRAFRTDGLIDL